MKNLGIILIVCFTLLACKKDPPVAPETPEEFENGLIVLNEGLFQQNNAGLSYYSNVESTVYQQVFFNTNKRGLGDTANDMVKYSLSGNEYIIIAVDVSSQIEIVEANTLKSVAQIPLFDGGLAKEPRRVIVNSNKAYICNYDGTVSIIDLYTYEIISTLNVGANPDGMVIIDNLLYVSNSGGLNYPMYDSSITIINMDSEQVTGDIETRINSSKMLVDADDEIYLLSTGNYADINPALLRIDSQTNSVIETFDIPITDMAIYDDWIYYYDSSLKQISRMNTLDESFDLNPVIDCSGFETFYKIIINGSTAEVFLIDAKSYVSSSIVSCYDISGNFKYEFTAGLNASNIVFN